MFSHQTGGLVTEWASVSQKGIRTDDASKRLLGPVMFESRVTLTWDPLINVVIKVFPLVILKQKEFTEIHIVNIS